MSAQHRSSPLVIAVCLAVAALAAGPGMADAPPRWGVLDDARSPRPTDRPVAPPSSAERLAARVVSPASAAAAGERFAVVAVESERDGAAPELVVRLLDANAEVLARTVLDRAPEPAHAPRIAAGADVFAVAWASAGGGARFAIIEGEGDGALVVPTRLETPGVPVALTWSAAHRAWMLVLADGNTLRLAVLTPLGALVEAPAEIGVLADAANAAHVALRVEGAIVGIAWRASGGANALWTGTDLYDARYGTRVEVADDIASFGERFFLESLAGRTRVTRMSGKDGTPKSLRVVELGDELPATETEVLATELPAGAWGWEASRSRTLVAWISHETRTASFLELAEIDAAGGRAIARVALPPHAARPDSLALATGARTLATFTAEVERDGESARELFGVLLPSGADDDSGETADAAGADDPFPRHGNLDVGPGASDVSIDATCDWRYVALDGDDTGNDCLDEMNPCQTIAYAIDQACVDDPVLLAEGVYETDILIEKSIQGIYSSGASSATRIQGSGTTDVVTILADDVIWDGVEVTGAPNHSCIRIGNETVTDVREAEIVNSSIYGCAVNVLVENTGPGTLQFFNRILSNDIKNAVSDGTAGTGIGVLLRGGNGKIEIKTNFIRFNDGAAIRVEAPPPESANDTIVITGNRVIQNATDPTADTTTAIELHDVTNVRIEGNRVMDHTGSDPGIDGRGILLDAVVGGNFDCNYFLNNDTGLELRGGTDQLPILHGKFEGHGANALYVESGSGGSVRINETIFTGNATAIDYDGDGTLDAQHSWWGTADGPTGGGGTGDPISGNVDVSNLIARSAEPILVRRPVDTGWAIGWSSCWDTVQPAIDSAVAGDLLIIGEGQYFNHLTVDKELDFVGIDGGAGCSPSRLDGTQIGNHDPTIRISNVSNISMSDLTIQNAGEGSTVCGENTGDEIGLDLQNVSSSTFDDMCFRENGVTELRVYGNSDDNVFSNLDIDGMIRTVTDADECGHRSREGVLIDGGATCEGGSGEFAERNRIEDSTMRFVHNGVTLRLARDTELVGNDIAASAATAWSTTPAAGVYVALAENTLVEANTLSANASEDALRIAGRESSSCITELTDSTDTTVLNNVISDVEGTGIRLYRGTGDPGAPRSTEITCNEILRNDIGVDVDFASSGAVPNFMRNNDVRRNSTGVRNLGITTFDAVENWWNDATGPGGGGPGNGDPVSGAVTFSPFLASSAFNDSDGDDITECEGDCDDTEATVYPGASEICDALDNDCDGSVDEDLPLNTYYLDGDGDGFGDAASPIEVCDATPPSGYVTNDQDCNDGDEQTYPGAPEILCDGIDQGCDGPSDETQDLDADGYDTCAVSDPGDGDGLPADCADDDPLRNPAARELSCDGLDNDCDGNVDDPGVSCSALDVSDLAFSAGSKSAMTWGANASDAYALYRGSIPPSGFERYDHGCEVSELGSAAAEDAETPPIGEAFYYLASGLDIDDTTGDVTPGPLGADSSGSNRPASTSFECGARVYVDPDALASSGSGLSWADAYTTLSRALDHSRGSGRTLEVWVKGSLTENRITVDGSRFFGLRVLGGFAGTESASWERAPDTNATSWSSSGGDVLADVSSGASLEIDGLTLSGGSRAVQARLEDGTALRLDDVDAVSQTDRAVDVTVDALFGASLTMRRSTFDASSQGGVRAVVERGTLRGRVRASEFAGGSDAAVRVEVRPVGPDAAASALAFERNTISGGALGLAFGAFADDAGPTATLGGVLRANVVHGTTGEGLRLDANGEFTSLGGAALARVSTLVAGNTISDVGGAGVIVSATRADATADPSLHVVESTPTLVANLITFAGSAAVEESADDAATNLLADPLLRGNGLFGGSSLYLDEGVTTLTLIGDVNALGSNTANWDEDPLYQDRLAANFRLAAGSPAIDRVDPAETGLGSEDREGSSRRLGAASDTGAYEAPAP